MAKREIKRTSCGFCQTRNDTRCKNCPGVIRGAMGGLDWTCWCSENGHPPVLAPGPVVTVIVEDKPESEEEGTTSAPTGDAGTAASKPKAPREKAPRCGHPTGKGPCNRKAGHTAGHDAR